MKIEKVIVLFFLVLVLILSAASPALAAGLVPCGGSPRCCDSGETAGDPNRGGCVADNPPNCEPRCQICHVFVLGQNIINFVLFTIVPPLAVLLVVVAGAMFILGSGYDPSLINQAKSMLQSVAIGLIIVYGSWVFINTFFVLIGLANTNLGNNIRNWFEISCSI